MNEPPLDYVLQDETPPRPTETQIVAGAIAAFIVGLLIGIFI